LAQYAGRRASAIIAGNSYIADWFSSVNASVHIIPTAVDPSRFGLPVVYERSTHTPFIVGWTGTYVNFPHLYAIEKGLNHFLSTHDHTKLRIIADRPPVFSQISADKIDYIAWSRSTETAVLSTLSVGIMPLVDDAWTRGKCAYKMLQYMAASLPVVVSPVGMNLEVVEDLQGCCLTATHAAQWSEALDFVYHHHQLARAWGQKGREVILQKYHVSIIAEKLAAVFSSFASC
jgi:glycosyltransferase involved in cell wall biosynthesis